MYKLHVNVYEKLRQFVTSMCGLNQQRVTSDEISQRLIDIRQLSEQTGEGTKELTVSTEQLSKLNSQLNGEVSRFKVG